MSLENTLKQISKLHHLDYSEFISDEIGLFIYEHIDKNHLGYTIFLNYGQTGKLDSIQIKCAGASNSLKNDCPHQDPTTLPELKSSIIYVTKHLPETDLQTQFRLGQIEYDGSKNH